MTERKDPGPIQPLRTLASAEESAELRRHYLQNLVHELSTPLTPLVGYLTLFEKGSLGQLTPLQQRCLRGMQRAATRLKQVLEDLSYLLQMESGVYRPQPESINAAGLIHRVLEETTDNAEEEQIEVLAEVDADVQLEGDETRLRGALKHLIWNGLKFNTAGGKLLIRAGVTRSAEGTDVVRIEVFDTGIGIKAEDLERVFEPFFQSDHTATRQFGGAGLGLPLVRWIVGLHGGHITLESPPSEQPPGHFFRGVRATVELPVAGD